MQVAVLLDLCAGLIDFASADRWLPEKANKKSVNMQ
jgi:hypothetical protein